MSNELTSEQVKSIKEHKVLVPTFKNENFFIKENKDGNQAIFHISGKKIYDIPESYSENVFEYDYYANGLLILTHQYSHFNYCGTTIQFFNNKGIKVLNEFYFKDENGMCDISVFADLIKCELGNCKTVIKNVNKALKQEETYLDLC